MSADAKARLDERDAIPTDQRWVVLAWQPGNESASWREVRPFTPDSDGRYWWPGATAGDAFTAAVLNNEQEGVKATSYYVLPWARGALINLEINLTAQEHK